MKSTSIIETALMRDTRAVALIRDTFRAYKMQAKVVSVRSVDSSTIKVIVALSHHIRLEVMFIVETKEHPLGFAFSASAELTSTLPEPSYTGGDVSKEHYSTPKGALKGLLAAFDDEVLDAFTFDLKAAREYVSEGVQARRALIQARKALTSITRQLQEW